MLSCRCHRTHAGSPHTGVVLSCAVQSTSARVQHGCVGGQRAQRVPFWGQQATMLSPTGYRSARQKVPVGQHAGWPLACVHVSALAGQDSERSAKPPAKTSRGAKGAGDAAMAAASAAIRSVVYIFSNDRCCTCQRRLHSAVESICTPLRPFTGASPVLSLDGQPGYEWRHWWAWLLKAMTKEMM